MLTKQLTMPQLPRFLERWLTDPPPQWVVEFSGQGIVRAATTEPLDLRVEPLPAGAPRKFFGPGYSLRHGVARLQRACLCTRLR
jgi:hypothetical protein